MPPPPLQCVLPLVLLECVLSLVPQALLPVLSRSLPPPLLRSLPALDACVVGVRLTLTPRGHSGIVEGAHDRREIEEYYFLQQQPRPLVL